MAEQASAAKEMGEGGRLFGVFWEPKPVFENLAARPRWWVPLILLTLLAIGYVTAFSRIVGWETFMRRQIQSNSSLQQLPPEQQEQIIEQQTKFGSIMGFAGGAAAVTISCLLVSAVLLGVFNSLAGANLKYKQAFSITCYAFLPTALSTILALIVMFLKNPEDFDLQNPLPLNLGAYLDPQSVGKGLHSVATSIDVFSIWVILLLALGFSAAAKRLRFPKSLVLVVSIWAVYVGVKSGWAAMFG